MALALNNFVGFETGGLEEGTTVAGSPAARTDVVRTGSYSLGPSSGFAIAPFESVSDVGDLQVVGYAAFFTEKGAVTFLFGAYEGSIASPCWSLGMEADGDITLKDATGTITNTITDPLSINTWHYFEILWEHQNTGAAIDIWIDGASALSVTNEDLSSGGTFDTYEMRAGLAGGAPYYDDFYCMSGATDTGDFLGPKTEVLGAYQNTVEDATDQGSALNNGTWANVGETPFNDGTVADYQQSGAIEGYTICDEGNRAGPAGDAPGTITGAKYIQRMARTNGSSPTTLDKSYGNSGDGVTATDVAATLTVAYQNLFQVSEAAGVVPTNSENFAFGMGQTGTGGRDVLAHEMAAFLLHTQPALSTTLADLNFPDQNYYLGPFGT